MGLRFVLLYDSATVAILKLLAAAAGTGIIASGQFLLDHRLHRTLCTRVLIGRCTLCGVSEVGATLCIARLGSAVLRSCLPHLLGIAHRYLAAHEYADNAVVDLINHRVKEGGALQFEDYERILLLIARVLY